MQNKEKGFVGRFTGTDNGIEITVETFYQQDYSNPLQHEFMFAYRVTITNHTNFPIVVHSRKWNIFDSTGDYRTVEGEGLVGVQPRIDQDSTWSYVSGCNLHSEIGQMFGQYTVENLDSGEFFHVAVPKFDMVAPFKLN